MGNDSTYPQHKATAWFAFRAAVAVHLFYAGLAIADTTEGLISMGCGLVVMYCSVQIWKIDLRKAGVEQVGG